jgi:Phosphotransferase enzyme family
MDEHTTTRLMAETVQEGLSRWRGRPVTVREFRREFFPRSSSFSAERVRVVLDGGEQVSVFFKDLNPEHQLNGAPAVRKRELEPSWRELQMYQQVLSRRRFGTPQLYGWRWAPQDGLLWLFLEDAGDAVLGGSADFDLWIAAARWAARFHAETRRLPAALTSCLRPYGDAQYRDCVERLQRKLTGLDAAYRPAILRALDYFVSIRGGFSALPHSVIHGEFFGKNIVVRDGSPDQPLAVVDWEGSAIGPSYLDLVSLTCGRWKLPQKQALWRAYFDRYQIDTGLRLDWESFCRHLARLALYHALKWLAWRPDWNFSIARWMRELDQALAGIP